MMTALTKISQADLEKLNIYLDGALSPKEKVAFEFKLAKSQPLQGTLREYTILRNALRSLPSKKAPHHFSLTTAEAQEARVNRKGFLAPVFSFASLVSVMLLAIVFTSDWIFKNMSAPAAPAAMQAPMAARVSESAEQPADARDSTDAPILFTWGSGAPGGFGMGGGSEKAIGGGDGQAALNSPYPSYSFDTRVINPGSAAQPIEGQPLPAEPVGEPETLRSAPPEEVTPAQPSAIVPADYAGAVIWGLLPDYEGKVIEVYPTATSDVQPEIAELVNQAESTSEEAVQPDEAPYQTAAWVKYSLAGLALLFGLLAFFFQRRFN